MSYGISLPVQEKKWRIRGQWFNQKYKGNVQPLTPQLLTHTLFLELVPGEKPLLNHKFYLDLKNRLVATKLETQIKELGGVSVSFVYRNNAVVLSLLLGYVGSKNADLFIIACNVL